MNEELHTKKKKKKRKKKEKNVSKHTRTQICKLSAMFRRTSEKVRYDYSATHLKLLPQSLIESNNRFFVTCYMCSQTFFSLSLSVILHIFLCFVLEFLLICQATKGRCFVNHITVAAVEFHFIFLNSNNLSHSFLHCTVTIHVPVILI